MKSEWSGGGVSVVAAITDTIPKPTMILEWGNSIPPDYMHRMYKGETATLMGEDGKPYALLLMDYFGTLREKRVDCTGAKTWKHEVQP